MYPNEYPLMDIALYLKRPTSSTPTSIWCRISYNAYRLKYYTDEKIHPKYWNSKAKPHRARESAKFPEYPEFNRRLDTIEATIKNTIREYINTHDNKPPLPAELKKMLDIAFFVGGVEQKVTFMSFLDTFIKNSENGTRLTVKGKPITPGTIKTYYTTKVVLENYQQHTKKVVDFDNIDMVFYTDFTKYLTLTIKQSTNYIGKHIKVIKTVLSDATEQKINTNLSYKSKGFTTISEETDTIYLPSHELAELAGIDLTENSSLDRVRDLFLIGCYTGLRYSDLSTLRPEHINEGMITIKPKKTGDTVVIPVHATVSALMTKYGGELPKALSNQKTNAALKDLGKLADALKKKISISFTKGGELVTEILPKWEFLTTHTARRSFATNQYLAGVPPITIMAITGHKTEKAFMKYIKVSSSDHAKIMQGVWDRQQNELVKIIAI